MSLSRLVLWLSRAAFVVLAGVGTASAVLPNGGGLHVLPWDKAEHFVCFYALAATGAFAFPKLKAPWLAAGLIALGAMIEIVQGLPMVARDSDVKDWIADIVAVGCALGPLVVADWRRRWRAGELG